MIPKENLIEIKGLFEKYFWLILIPFSLYLGSTLYHILDMKKSIKNMSEIVENDSNIGLEALLSNFDHYAYLTKKKFEKKRSFEYCQASISSLRWEGIENWSQWRDEINKRIAFGEGVLSTLLGHYNRERKIIEIDNWLLDQGEEYPILRKYISYKLAESLFSGFASSFGFSSTCYSGYFNPVIQRFGNNYYVYPEKVDNLFHEKSLDLKVNGRRIYDNTYSFKPENSGMKYLDIEYTFWDHLGLQTLNFRKGLMVQ